METQTRPVRMTKAEKARRGRQLHFWRGRLREAYLRLQALDPETWTPAGLAAEMEAEDWLTPAINRGKPPMSPECGQST